MSKRRKYSSERVDCFLTQFSKESSDIREELLYRLPAYNKLIDMKAYSFDQLALLYIAEKDGIDTNSYLFSYDSVRPPCPFCESRDTTIQSDGRYKCASCGKPFKANHNSISSYSNLTPLEWMKFIHCMLNCYTIEETCNYCDIYPNTYYLIRTRIFYAMQLMMNDVKLYGKIQCDNTFVRANYSGLQLEEKDFPEDSPLYEEKFIPRAPRKRGGNPQNGKELNSICVFTAIDDSGHVLAKSTGLGNTTAARIKKAVGDDKILLAVPNKDPFQRFLRPITKKPETKTRDKSLLISDKEAAIGKYACSIGINHEAHVYHKNGVYLRLPAGANNIQKVNKLHQKLKTFLENVHYVSSKYLPGYLTLFEFIENTGGSDHAIKELMKIIAAPGLGKSPEFYNLLFTAPNYLEQWLSYDNPLKKLKYEQILAFYLYSERLNAIKRKAEDIMPVQEICEICGMTDKTVRRNHDNLKTSNYTKLIYDFFDSDKESSPIIKTKSPFSQMHLAMYDEYYELRKHPNCISFKKFTEQMCEKYGISCSLQNLDQIFKRIEKSSIRPPLPPKISVKESPIPRLTPAHYKALEWEQKFQQKLQEYKAAGIKKYKYLVIEEMALEENIKVTTLECYLDKLAPQAKKIMEQLKQEGEK